MARDSETTDPFTGEKREMFRTRGTNWSVGFRHDLSGKGLSYGLDLNRLIGVSRTDDVRDRWRYEDDIEMSAFLEPRIIGGMTLRFDRVSDRLYTVSLRGSF